MVAWRCCSCWAGLGSGKEISSIQKETRSFDIPMEAEMKIEKSGTSEVLVLSDMSNESKSEWSPQKRFDSDVLSDETDVPKRTPKLPNENTSSAFLTEMWGRQDKWFKRGSSRLQQPGQRISRASNSKLQASGPSEVSEPIRGLIDFSISGDGSWESGDPRISNNESSTLQRLGDNSMRSTNDTDVPKRPPKFAADGSSSILLMEKRSRRPVKRRSNRVQQPGPVLSRPSPGKIQAAGLSEAEERLRQQTVISDWNDAYEEGGDFGFSCESSLRQRVVDSSIWSDISTTKNSESGLVVKRSPSSPLNWPVIPGMVMAMHLTKDGQRFKKLNLDSSIQDVVNTFLKTKAGPSIPVSFSYSNNCRPRVMSVSWMGMSLSENLKGLLDPTKQGIVFSAGSVNRKLCYKMSISELKHFENLAQAFPRQSG